MATIREDTKGKTRDLPIHDTLKAVLSKAADAAGIALVRVTSGGQCRKGTCDKRTGSRRHDDGYAADLQLLADGHRALDFTKASDRSIVEKFRHGRRRARRDGHRRGGRLHGLDDAPCRLRNVAARCVPAGLGGRRGRRQRAGLAPEGRPEGLAVPPPATASRSVASTEGGHFAVIARGGLKLRAGPSLDFPILSSIGTGTVVTVTAFDGPLGDWARVDIAGDGLVDGHVHRSFLEALDGPDGSPRPPNGVSDGASEEAEEPGEA